MSDTPDASTGPCAHTLVLTDDDAVALLAILASIPVEAPLTEGFAWRFAGLASALQVLGRWDEVEGMAGAIRENVRRMLAEEPETVLNSEGMTE